MQGMQVAKNTTRGGGGDNARQAGVGGCEVMGRWRTQYKAIRRLTTQQEEGGRGHNLR
jgi:hypothetical protein